MGDAPFVTFVIPTYDRWPLLAEAVLSAQATGGDVEVIVVDDGSKDDTASRLRHEHPEVTVLTQPNSGRSAARNAGLRAARGCFVTFLDSDDVVEPWHVAQVREAVKTAPEPYGTVFCAPVVLWDPVTGIKRDVSTPRYLPKEVARASLAGTVLTLPGLFIPRSLILRIGGFVEELRGSEDWVLAAVLTRHAAIHRLPHPSVRVRIHDDRSMADVTWDLNWRDAATAWLLENPDLALDDRERRLVLAGTARYRAARLYESGDTSRSQRELLALVRQLGPVTGIRWSWRLAIQSLVPARLRAAARTLR